MSEDANETKEISAEEMKGLIERRKEERALANRGIAKRNADAREEYRRTKDPRKAILAYCRGNKWLMENARAVGNLHPGR